MFGAHLAQKAGEAGVRFAVWAPHARAVSVVGDFNGWDAGAHPMQRSEDAEIWTCFIPGLAEGAVYKYAIETPGGARILKAVSYTHLISCSRRRAVAWRSSATGRTAGKSIASLCASDAEESRRSAPLCLICLHLYKVCKNADVLLRRARR